MTHEKTDTATDDRMSGGGKEDGERGVEGEKEDRDDGANALKRKPLDKLTHLLYQE